MSNWSSFDPQPAMPPVRSPAGPPRPVTGAGGIETILGAVESALGVMYQWGGNSLAKGVDCSGLLQQAFRAAGYSIPRVSAQQANTGAKVTGALQVGDLLSWDNSSRNNGADHIAIYIGNGQMIEARKTGTPVQVSAVRPGYSANRIIGHVPRKAIPDTVQFGPNQDRRYTTAAISGAGRPEVGTADGGAAQGGAGPAPVGAMFGAGGPQVNSRIVSDGAGGFRVETPSGRTISHGASDQEIELYVQENYPQFSGLFQVPELKGLIMRSATEGWDDVQFAAAFRQTKWYQETAPVAREWIALEGADPAAATKRRQDREREILDEWLRAGGWDDKNGVISKLAHDSLMLGWSPSELQRRIYETIATKPGITRGTITDKMDQMKALAADNLIPMSHDTLRSWAIRIGSGTATEEGYRSYVAQLAKAQFAGDAQVLAHLNAGGSVAEYFAPHRERVATILERSANEIDLMDPKWGELLEHVDDKGVKRSRTLGEATAWAYQQDEFGYTEQANAEASALADQLLTTLGKKR